MHNEKRDVVGIPRQIIITRQSIMSAIGVAIAIVIAVLGSKAQGPLSSASNTALIRPSFSQVPFVEATKVSFENIDVLVRVLSCHVDKLV